MDSECFTVESLSCAIISSKKDNVVIVILYVISNDFPKYNQVINTFPEIGVRYKHIIIDLIGELYSAELQLKKLRCDIGL